MSLRLDPRVLEAMRPYFSERFGNPSSDGHSFGEEAREAVERARTAIGAFVGAIDGRGVVFTSGLVESDDLAARGFIEAIPKTHPARWITALHGARRFRRLAEVIPINLNERTFEDQLVSTSVPHTTLISLGCDEHGRAPDALAFVCALARERGAIVHLSGLGRAVAAPLAVDLVSIDARALGTPEGVGALWIRPQSPPIRLRALIPGGGQEHGLRGGTLNVPGIVGLGAAVAFAS